MADFIQLAFNKGRRMDVGMGLAHAEIHEAMKAVLDRLTDVRLDPLAEPPLFKDPSVRSWRPLNVVFGYTGEESGRTS